MAIPNNIPHIPPQTHRAPPSKINYNKNKQLTCAKPYLFPIALSTPTPKPHKNHDMINIRQTTFKKG
jgi:hypothetical protein